MFRPIAMFIDLLHTSKQRIIFRIGLFMLPRNEPFAVRPFRIINSIAVTFVEVRRRISRIEFVIMYTEMDTIYTCRSFDIFDSFRFGWAFWHRQRVNLA